jgi:uncharacterized protein DUF4304
MSIANVVRRNIAPLMQSAGFTQRYESFYRRNGTTYQVVEIQRSMESSFAGPKMFYVNIGIAFDDLRILYGKPAIFQPTIAECDFHGRLSDLVPGSPIVWAIKGSGILDNFLSKVYTSSLPQPPFDVQDELSAGQRLARDIRQVLDQLDKIHSSHSFMQSLWNNAPGTDVLGIILRYVDGDLDGSWQELQRVSKKFADREGMSIPNLIDRLRLVDLKDRMN